MADLCRWLHDQLERLPVVRYPFDLNRLPENGIYFFYEKGEAWGHGQGGDRPRIVRIGTHREGNFRKRIAEHFLLNEAKMNFDATSSPPHDRSIFRKNIGRALLNRSRNQYLTVWNIDFTTRESREKHGRLRDIGEERQIEAEVTRLLRENFSFTFVMLDGQTERMGSAGLEARLIGTVARCSACLPSSSWLGRHSPVEKIRQSGLWLVQHLAAEPLCEADQKRLVEAIAATRNWRGHVLQT